MKLTKEKCFIVILIALMTACSTRNYSYRSIQQPRNKKIMPPAGMVYIPGGTLLLGKSTLDVDQDSSMMKKVSLSAFFIDKHEVSNLQYRQFVNWVRDSIVVHLLNEKSFFKRSHRKDSTKKINWAKLNGGEAIWNSRDPKIKEKVNALLNEEGRIDPHLLNYEYVSSLPDPSDPKGLKKIIKRHCMNVWPNEMVWINDFPNSQNIMMAKAYFTDPLFDNHPVVGVSWKQARAFATWRSKVFTGYTNKIINPYIAKLPMDLPTEAQWTYACQMTHPTKTKPTKNPHDFNFKQGEGTYNVDGSTYTNHVMAYEPNAAGLYNMPGNVSEWTMDAYREGAKAFVHDLNPVMVYDAKDDEPLIMQQKVVKGGSWKDAAIFSDPTIRVSETQNSGRSYIGFRCVMPAPELNLTVTSLQPSVKEKTVKEKKATLSRVYTKTK